MSQNSTVQGLSTQSGAMSASLQDVRTHLHASIHGTWDVGAALELARGLAAELAQTDHKRLLLDTTAVGGDLTLEERHRMGFLLGEIFSGAHKAAIVQEVREQNGYAAKIARRQGSTLLVFRYVDDAVFWLLA